MQRARRPNRQSRRGNGQNQNPSRGNGPSHAHTNSPRPPRANQNYTSVPAYASITAGTSVSIVLKVDQPTGRQVTGIVADVLTSGDHPRGVKVRLRDGRVGRVQRLVSDDEGVRGEEEAGGIGANLGRNGENGGIEARGVGSSRGGRGRGRGRGGFRHVQDVRNDEYLWDENRSQNLGSYFAGLDALEEMDAGNAGGRGEGREAGLALNTEMVICPVCQVFEGDERAVAHHVEEHFA